ncbi:hypothetical protein ABIA69_001849 [Lysinibacillus parviboronicapiens]|uniref:Uncharacterized protein n=1 Tax=Lysinibacillus parviboronicapiens TaxID=436516 RepID=A0ABV2PIF7_9BACI
MKIMDSSDEIIAALDSKEEALKISYLLKKETNKMPN